MKLKQITIHAEQQEVGSAEGIFLVNPTWVHLDDKEVKERLERNEKLFKVKVGDQDEWK
jgi:hypothetical protein